MTHAANVKSIEHIRGLRTAMIKFEEASRDAITLLALEVRRAIDWIENDRRRYWPAQIKKASQQLAERRAELERCEMRFGSEEAPSCYEQKKAYQRARERLRYCEDQVRVTRRWIRTVRQELTEYEGQMAQMTTCIDSDLPRAIAVLAKMLGALEKYAHERQLTDISTTDPAATAASKEQEA